MIIIKSIQVVLRNIITLYYRVVLSPSDDFDRNIIFKMVWDRRPILKVLNEKVASLKYVSLRVPEVKSAHRYYETKDLGNVDWSILPSNFVIKASHGSGGVIIVHDSAPIENRLPRKWKRFGWRRLEVHPDNFDREIAVKIFTSLLKKTYGQGLNRGGPEWAYWGNEPHVIIEDFLAFRAGMPLRISCNVVHEQISLFYWDQMNFPLLGKTVLTEKSTHVPPLSIQNISSGLNLSESDIERVIEMSLRIAGQMDYLRVDWLVSNDGIFFSELTNYCGGGALRGQSYFQQMSAMWRPNRKDYL